MTATDPGRQVPLETQDHLRPQERLVRMMQQGRCPTLAYKVLKLLGVEIPPNVQIGEGFQLAHGAVGVVISPAAKIGANVKIFQGVTLGYADEFLSFEERPRTLEALGGVTIEDDVVIGAGAKVLFKTGQVLTVGKGAIIGANAVVVTSVPPGEVWAGVPARRIRSRT